MTTTHDRAYNMKGSGAKRTVPRNQPQGPYNPVSTMMSDFKVKTIDEPVMVSLIRYEQIIKSLILAFPAAGRITKDFRGREKRICDWV